MACESHEHSVTEQDSAMASVENHHLNVLASLLEQQQQGLFADTELQFRDGKTSVSRNLMVSISPVFRGMFLAKMAEARDNVVKFDDFSKETWQCVLDFYCSTRKTVTEANVAEVLSFSHMYHLEALQNYCAEFLTTTMSADNCLAVKGMAEKFSLGAVEAKTKRFTLENFYQVGKTEDYLSLKEADLEELLKDDDLVTTEDDLSLALLTWMERNHADEATVERLFRHVRLSEMSTDCLVDHVMYHSVLRDNTTVGLAVKDEIKRRCSDTATQTSQSKPRRRGDIKSEEIIVVSGCTISHLLI